MPRADTSRPPEAELPRDPAAALLELERGWNSWLSRRWADVVVLAAAAVLLTRFAFVVWGALQPKPPGPRARVDLPGYTLLRPQHIDPGADGGAGRLVGRYLARPVRARSPIDSASLGPASLRAEHLAGRHVLTLQLAAGAAPDSLRAGTIADLLLSPATPAPGASPVFVQAVPVLAVTAAGEGMRLVVAVDRGQLDALAPRIGSSRVFVLTGGGGAPAPAAVRDRGRAPADSAGG